ncbi:MAG: hypothetical protein K6G24_04660 [Lachnospiraceae bacterium]|nr:hypothetical protein [Lachnospiraceae bacterium]
MNKKIAGIISVGLCSALMVAGIRNVSSVSADEEPMETVSVNTSELEAQNGDPATDGTELIGKKADNLIKSLLSDSEQNMTDTTKEETVFVIADANGASKKVIVSDWVKNVNKEAKISDVSELTDIENVKGDETYNKNGNECVWEANGSDISYQGKTDKELPVEVKVTYTLDGKTVTPEEIKGKSGHVVIRFDYLNKTSEEVMIDGKKENMCVPFAMLTGVIFDDEKFTNISAPSCKLINDGSRTVAIGLAFPGLQDSLAIDRDKFEIPESIEISADVKDFSLTMSLTVATNEIFGRLSSVDIKDLDSLSDSMAELTEGMQKLMEGSGALSDGLNQLLEKSGDIENGVGLLAEGSLALKNGIASADEGAGKIADGAGALSDGAGTLSAGITSLKEGSGQLVAGTDALSSGAGQLSVGVDQLDAGAGALSDGAAQLKTGLDTLAGNNKTLVGGAEQVFNTLLATAESQLKAAGADIPSLTIDNYGTILDAATNKLSEAAKAMEKADPQTAAVYSEKAKTIAGLKASLDGYNTFYAGLKTYTDGVAQAATGAGSIKEGADALKAGTGAVKEGADALKTGADTLKGGMTQLDTGAEALKAGADQLKGGADQLKNGADSLKDGTGKLLDGAGTLNGGLNELKDNIPALKDGVTQLRDGSVLLADGIKEFNDRGIQKITEAVEGELEGLIERVRAMGDLAKAYNNFSGISEGMNGQVKFIFRTDEIK